MAWGGFAIYRVFDLLLHRATHTNSNQAGLPRAESHSLANNRLAILCNLTIHQPNNIDIGIVYNLIRYTYFLCDVWLCDIFNSILPHSLSYFVSWMIGLPHWFDSTNDVQIPAMFRFPDLPIWETGALLIRPSHLVGELCQTFTPQASAVSGPAK